MTSRKACYKRLSDNEFIAILKDIKEEFDDYLQYGLGYRREQYFICGLDIVDAIIRVDKRLAYFSYFHKGMKINAGKAAALFAYWIIKLRPIKIVDDKLTNSVEHSAKINEKLAIHHLLSALVGLGKVKLWDGSEGVDLDSETNRFLKELCYSFRFRNFTIDSMIVLADAINTQSFL